MSENQRNRRVVLTERLCEIPRLVRRFGLLSRDQIMSLCRFGSITRVNTKTADLVRAGILQRKTLPVLPGHGSAQALYFLGKASGTVLGIGAREISRQIRQVSRWDFAQVEHVRVANQTLVDFVASLRRKPEWTLVAFHTELELRRVFLDRGLVPDGWLSWTADGKRFNCFTEIDLQHEGLTVWRAKILEYLRYAESGQHQELLGYRAFRVLVLAKSRARLHNLRQIAREAGQMFLFAEVASVNVDTNLERVWLPASGSVPVALAEA